MEVTSRNRRFDLKDREISPERRKVWTEPSKLKSTERKVPVVYYLSRNGHLEHPHFMEISIPSNQGLYLRDVINRLDSLRGKGMASMYAWSSKRSYKNGFVWHDLTEDDFIYPAHSNEYVLKGSELLHLDSLQETPLEAPKSVKDDCEISLLKKTKPEWISFGLSEYKVYKNHLRNMDACTQTGDHQFNAIKEDEEEMEISPPSSSSFSSSSSETLEALIKSDGRIVPIGNENEKGKNVSGNGSKRKISRTPSALMQLFSCGAISVVSQFRGRIPSGMLSRDGVRGSESESVRGVELEEKEFFSGSLIELKKESGGGGGGDISGLRRSSSCNAERGLKMELKEKEIDGVQARCLFTRLKTTKSTMTKKEEKQMVDGNTNESMSVIDESKSLQS